MALIEQSSDDLPRCERCGQPDPQIDVPCMSCRIDLYVGSGKPTPDNGASDVSRESA